MVFVVLVIWGRQYAVNIQDNEKTLSFMDCAHERCVNTGACEIYRQAKALECK